MADTISRSLTDRLQLQQLIAGLPEGIIIVTLDGTISWANEAALALHGVKTFKELGGKVTDYCARFELRYRDRQRLPADEYPLSRLIAGDSFSELIVEVASAGRGEKLGVQRLRNLVLTDPEREPACLALIIDDETEQFDAEDASNVPLAPIPHPPSSRGYRTCATSK